jgi:hypothetical protein
VVFHAEPAKQTHRTQSRLEESDTDRGAAPTWHWMPWRSGFRQRR